MQLDELIKYQQLVIENCTDNLFFVVSKEQAILKALQYLRVIEPLNDMDFGGSDGITK